MVKAIPIRQVSVSCYSLHHFWTKKVRFRWKSECVNTGKSTTRREDRTKPMVPRMGNLPEVRLQHHIRPFTDSGDGYFGTLEVTIGRRRR